MWELILTFYSKFTILKSNYNFLFKKRFRFLPKRTKHLLNLAGLTTQEGKMFNSEYKYKKTKEPTQHTTVYRQNSDSNRNSIEFDLENLESKTKQIRIVRPELYDK
ncbi:hypothetical protein ACO2J1_01835 [Leptospira interrogans]|uniref:Uncharacterized protein n=12 Tax=Leptospira interrogans TaxID=173 RepID=Q8F6X0_LEPIN|nr:MULTISPECIES: hypothetical protein [Leptospira]AKH76566.1 hypothetical protein BRAT_05565 [Leptospira interrogans serovar Bratislava]EMF71329.1 hypothetical protein LEP1GSC148_4264 [Leptospira interrogans serovar Canicola str. LT1962]EMG09801.1 hypothetical protein LEP1GSC151_1190 [Leptospira interrogans serovar Grippotyphosa str. LT2186]EMM83788.1 hypothetical protein LEP1GSC037_0787 [Leptospira interrogans str. 2006001854]EMM97215.1 hypothetical protein LEP1GSC158_2755 [Leptospira interro